MDSYCDVICCCVQVRERPMYMLIKAQILKKQDDLQEAINCLKAAMALPGVRSGGGKKASLFFVVSALFVFEVFVS